jgi:hypothetical protein
MIPHDYFHFLHGVFRIHLDAKMSLVNRYQDRKNDKNFTHNLTVSHVRHFALFYFFPRPRGPDLPHFPHYVTFLVRCETI